jgi:glycosyltransferase involved in cell wall biosynthesis
MRVIFLTHFYPPEVGAPQTRIKTLARRLSDRGVVVTVHTGFPHYPSGHIQSPYRNHPWLVERDGPVRIVRSAVYASPNRGFFRRLVDHASFGASALMTLPLSGKADVVVVESPPLFLAVAAVGYARAKGAALVLNIADRWPASAVELGVLRDRRAIAAAEGLEAFCYRHASAIVTPTGPMAEALDRHPSASGRVHTIEPAVDLERFPCAYDHPGDQRPMRVIYAGTLGMAQGLETLIRAAEVAGRQHVEVTIAGDGADEPALRARLERRPTANVRLIGTLAPDDVPGLYVGADVGVVLLRDRPIFNEALPTKMLEILAAGRPAVVAARGNAARVVEEAGAGIAVPPEDPGSLASAFLTLAGDPAARARMGAAGRRLAEDRFARNLAVARWHELARAVVAAR